jgi:hypothetical protein
MTTALPPRILLRLAVVALLARGGVDARGVQAQARSWEEREYGIGVVKYAAMGSYSAKDVILAAPSPSADTVASLDGASLCLGAPRHCVRSFDRMIEFAYEIPGWAILKFSSDSAWVQVTLHPSEPPGLVGWVRLRPDSVEALLWSDILPRHRLFFLRSADTAFYSAPDVGARVSRKLAEYPRSRRLNYIMNPLEVRGAWLRVELLSPSTMCEFPQPNVTPDTVWIHYLTPEHHPTVFYYTRGC